jgi:hypothetical protein
MSDAKQLAVSDLPRIIPCLKKSRFWHSTLVVLTKQLNQSAIATRITDNGKVQSTIHNHPLSAITFDKNLVDYMAECER